MLASLIIPSYRRPTDLARGLQACLQQIRPYDEIIVVARAEDQQTQDVVKGVISREKAQLRLVTVVVPGVIAAMQAGLNAVSTDADVICLTDDDTAPREDWLERILGYFETDPALAGVGGRDWQWRDGKMDDRSRPVVGIIQWFGRVIGNHHLGVGGPREVDILKGANCAFRADLLRKVGFDHRLRGGGAQVHWEMSLCLKLRRQGWRLVYDPEVAVDHYIAKRADADVNHRGGFHGPSLTESVHNETFVLLEQLELIRRGPYSLWAIFVGTSECPGAAQLIRLLFKGRSNALARWRATLRGRLAGVITHQQFRSRERHAGKMKTETFAKA